MPKEKALSLTTFVDFVLKAGTPKITVVKTYKEQEDYNPATDFYKPLRDAIVKMHETGQAKTSIDKVLGAVDARKHDSYAAVIAGYKAFLGKKQFAWFKPPSAKWNEAGISVSINPEIGLAGR